MMTKKIIRTSSSVAPFVGAWIEMMKSALSGTVETVAPFVGAWIEIIIMLLCLIVNDVAPFVGAWIEICPKHITRVKCMSLRSSERGLKFQGMKGFVMGGTSLRSSERGLKSVILSLIMLACLVAPFVGAWIEISSIICIFSSIIVAPFVGAWIEIEKKELLSEKVTGRSVRRSVD